MPDTIHLLKPTELNNTGFSMVAVPTFIPTNGVEGFQSIYCVLATLILVWLIFLNFASLVDVWWYLIVVLTRAVWPLMRFYDFVYIGHLHVINITSGSRCPLWIWMTNDVCVSLSNCSKLYRSNDGRCQWRVCLHICGRGEDNMKTFSFPLFL